MGYCEDCGNTLCICDEIPTCPACGEKGHYICGTLNTASDAGSFRRIKELEAKLALAEKEILSRGDNFNLIRDKLDIAVEALETLRDKPIQQGEIIAYALERIKGAL